MYHFEEGFKEKLMKRMTSAFCQSLCVQTKEKKLMVVRKKFAILALCLMFQVKGFFTMKV